MRNFLTYTIPVALLMLSSMADDAAIAKHVHVPKHCPVKPTGVSTADNVFSSPDTQPDVVPAFVSKKGQPINADMQPRLPGFDHAKLLSNLSKDQQKQIKTLQDSTNVAVQAVQEQINGLNQQLDALKTHPKEDVKVQKELLPKMDDLKTQIAGLRKSIEQKRRDAVQDLQAILTAEQRDQITRMRHGELVHDPSEMKDAERKAN